MERTYDEEIHKRINHVFRERTCVQMERSEDASQNRVNTFGKQWVSSQTVGESKQPWTLLCRARVGSLGEKLDES